jgi:hypothetical protein
MSHMGKYLWLISLLLPQHKGRMILFHQNFQQE